MKNANGCLVVDDVARWLPVTSVMTSVEMTQRMWLKCPNKDYVAH